jgi:transposase
MDYYSLHKGKEVEKFIEAVGARVIYLQRYSPDFSPLKNF